MSLLPGKFIDKEVAKQIAKRQEVIGNKDRLPLFSKTDPRSYNFFLTKTPFIKLTSGIDKSGLQDPARQAILDNGYRGRGGDTSGIVPGYEFSDDFGMRPGAGITGMQMNTHNRYGSLRTATVQFEVHSLEQMNLYEEMFMRPGYSALLEWGHSVWLDSETGEVNDMPPLLSESFIRKSLVSDILPSRLSEDEIANESKQAIYLAIEEMRRKTDYNYDGMYGLIKNFSWALRPDGGYSCTVDIVSIGTVIESLDINAGITSQEITKDFFTRSTDLEELEVVGERERESIFYNPWLKGERRDEETITREEEAFAQGLRDHLVNRGNAPKVELLSNITDKDESIIYNIDLSSQFLFYARGAFTDKADQTTEDWYTEDDVYKSLQHIPGQDTTITVKLKNPDAEGEAKFVNVFFKVDLIETKFEEKVTGFYRYAKIKRAPEFTYKLTRVKNEPFGNAATEAAIQPIFDEKTKKLLAALGKRQVEDFNPNFDLGSKLLANLIKSFNPEYSSRIHLTLYLLKNYLETNVAETMKPQEDSPATEVYQEIEFRPVLDVEKDDPRYQETNFPVLPPQLESDYVHGAVRRKLGESTTGEFHYYLQLGTFLDILNLYVPSTISTKERLFEYHTDKSNPHAYKTLASLHASVDITKCILPDSYGVKNFTTRGDILGIFIEIEYALGLVEKGLSNGKLRGYDIVTEILSDINIATGQINELSLHYHEESFKFHVVDRKLVGVKKEDTIELSLIGRNTILRNITMNSKLSPSISTQIAISAQSDPQDNGISGTLFERFNKNLKDRYIPEKKTNFETLEAQEKEKEEETQAKVAVVMNYLRFVYGGKETITQQVDLPGVLNEYKLMTSIILNQEGIDRSYGGILPFELGLEIEGISGMNVMSTFLINQTILPKSYVGEGNFGFLITGLTHKVDNSGWVTTVKSQIYNRPRDTSREKASIGTLNFKGEEKEEFRLVKENHTPWEGDTPFANFVRGFNAQNEGTIKKKPDYKYDELSSGADIQPFLASTTVIFIKAFRKEYSDYNIRITGGNDVWHHNHAPASQHTKGRGLDFTIRKGNTELGSDDKIIIEISNWIGRYFADMKEDVYYLDEYNETRQSNHATGNHFHFHVLKDE